MDPRLAALALLALPLAGCAAPGPAATPSDLPAAALPRPDIAVPSFLEPIELGTVTLGAEPSVAVAPDGTVYVVTPLALWRSDDGGRTYQALGAPRCPMGLPACGPFEERHPDLQGGGDASLAVGLDGAVHWLGLFGEDASIPYQVSLDRGMTFSDGVDLADGNSTDREWIVAGATGALFAQWRDFGAACEAPLGLGCPEAETGILLRRSDDGGATWAPSVRAADDGRQGPVAADPGSAWLYLPHIADGGVRVARSQDGGAAWEDVAVAGAPGGTFNFPVAAVDGAGVVYLVWAADPAGMVVPEYNANRMASVPEVFLAVSRDHGASWSEPKRLSAEGRPAVFPWIAAGAPGRAAVAWYQAELGHPSGRAPNLWYPTLAVTTTADADEPAWQVARLSEDPNHVGPICNEGSFCTLTAADRSMLDFFEVRLLPDGSPVVAWAADADARMATARVVATRMVEGTPLL